MKNEQHSVILFGSLAFVCFFCLGEEQFMYLFINFCNGVFVTLEFAQSLLAEMTEVCHRSPKNNKALLPSFLVN